MTFSGVAAIRRSSGGVGGGGGDDEGCGGARGAAWRLPCGSRVPVTGPRSRALIRDTQRDWLEIRFRATFGVFLTGAERYRTLSQRTNDRFCLPRQRPPTYAAIAAKDPRSKTPAQKKAAQFRLFKRDLSTIPAKRVNAYQLSRYQPPCPSSATSSSSASSIFD